MSDELYHHGIKNQRWGVRNGPPYPLSAKKHSSVVSKKPKNSRKASVSLSKKGEAYIPEGSLLYRVQGDRKSHAKAGNKVYAVTSLRDKTEYEAQLATQVLTRSGKVFAAQYEAKKMIEFPSIKTQEKIERALLRNPEVRNDVIEAMKRKGYPEKVAKVMTDPYASIKAAAASTPLLLIPTTGLFSWGLTSGFLSRLAKSNQNYFFEQSIGDKEAVALNKAFEKRLSELGYSGYRDLYDRKLPDFDAKTAVVIFNPDKSLKMVRSEKHDYNDYLSAFSKYKPTASEEELSERWKKAEERYKEIQNDT